MSNYYRLLMLGLTSLPLFFLALSFTLIIGAATVLADVNQDVKLLSTHKVVNRNVAQHPETDVQAKIAYYNETFDHPLILDDLTTGDNCSDPIIISSFPYSDTTNNSVFTNEYNFGGPDVVYEFTITECQDVVISLCNTDPVFDTYLLLYEPGDCGDSAITEDDDYCTYPDYGTSQIMARLEAGTYYFIVDAYSGQTGTYILDVTIDACPPIPSNDDCENAIEIGEVDDYPFTNIAATTDNNGDCHEDLQADVWYRYTAGCTGTATFWACDADYDGFVGIFTDDCDTIAECIAFNDDGCGGGQASIVSWPVVEDETYLICLGGWAGSMGAGPFDVTCQIPANIDVQPASVSGSASVGGSDTEVLTVSNIGSGDLEWDAYVVQDLPNWLDIDIYSGTCPPDIEVTVFMDAVDLDEDIYTGSIVFESNDPVAPELIIPVTFEVITSCYEYLPGDVNMYSGMWPPAANALDIVYIVNYFRQAGAEECLIDGFWASADINGDCIAPLGSDVTSLISYLVGSPTEIEYCADYEPCWQDYNELPEDPPAGWPNCENVALLDYFPDLRLNNDPKDAEVNFWVGNQDGSPIGARPGHNVNINVYVQTSDSSSCLHFPLGVNDTYIDSMVSQSEGIDYYPLNVWFMHEFLKADSSPPNPAGWSNQSYLGISQSTSPGSYPYLHYETPTKILTFVARTVNDSLLVGDTVACLATGVNPRNGSILVGDTLGLTAFTANAAYSQIYFAYPYLPGDVNMYHGIWEAEVIGSDVTYLVNYFRVGSTSQPCLFNGFWASADANGDCKIIGSDVTRLVNYLRGTTDITWCGEDPEDSLYYPPFWFSGADVPDTPPYGWTGPDPAPGGSPNAICDNVAMVTDIKVIPASSGN